MRTKASAFWREWWPMIKRMRLRQPGLKLRLRRKARSNGENGMMLSLAIRAHAARGTLKKLISRNTCTFI
jgi:hypothetical protein